jgi:TetR/AcrR family transcriptional regulator, transcriptional repressor of aconitase
MAVQVDLRKNELSWYLDAECSLCSGSYRHSFDPFVRAICERVLHVVGFLEAVNESQQQRSEELRIPMPASSTKPRKRLTREESRAQTRATLIAVGRRHFLRYGVGGAVAEKIAEDAGYSRGALYSNFDGKEELFLAVIQEEQAYRLNFFRSLLKDEPPGKRRLRKMRDAIADLLTDHDWIVLRAEFEAAALRSERIRQNFVEMHRQQIRDGGELVRDLLRSPEVTSRLKPDDFITVIINLAHGMAVTQRILGAELSQKSTRSLVQSLFDHLISSA